MKLNTCIILNGCAGIGKDTIANIITKYSDYIKCEFKEGLYIETAKYFNIYTDIFVRRARDRVLKETPWRPLNNGTILNPREALIYVSEVIIKPNKGSDYFGKLAVDKCIKFNLNNVIFSDGGFEGEVISLSKVYKNVIICHLFRDNFTWGKDSRRYIAGIPNTVGIQLVTGDPDRAVNDILKYVTSVKNNTHK